MPADDNIKMKDAFSKEMENLSSSDYFYLMEKKIE